jgi:hypothetical protein
MPSTGSAEHVRRLGSLLACAAALALAACGSDDGPSVEAYRGEARAICSEADRAIQQVRQPTRTTPEAIADYFRRLLAPAERTTRRFEALQPPEELARAHDDVVRANRASVREVRQLIGRLEGDGDPRELLAGVERRIASLTREADAAAERLGVPECGQ